MAIKKWGSLLALWRSENMKSQPLFVALLLGALCMASCTPEQERTTETSRYPNGRLRGVAALLNGRLDGRSVAYYPNGKVHATSHWVAGRRTGVTRLYYPDGVLRDSSAFRNDSLHGPAVRYYPNGVLQERAQFTNGTRTGLTMLFDSLGKPMDREIYNRAGRLIYANRYEPDGRPFSSGMMTLIDAPDTLDWGEKYTGSVYFGYPLRSPATMLVGTLGKGKKASDSPVLVDTFQVVAPSTDGRFYFAYYPKRAGDNAMGYRFLQPGSPWDARPRKDSLSVDYLAGDMPFYVREPRRKK